MPRLDREGDVFVLDLSDDDPQARPENRFTLEWLAAVDELLDEAAAGTGPAALVTTGRGKFYSNGLDLEWLGANLDRSASYVQTIQGLFAKMLTYPMATVAACNGHVFAGGAMLAVAHDARVMRADRGFFCLPEVDISIPFTPGMAALLQGKLSAAVAHEAMTTGRRYGGEQAQAAGIVDEAVPEEQVLARAVERATALTGKRGPTLAAIRSTMYAPALAALADVTGISFSG